MKSIKLGNRVIDATTSPYIIAEIGINHNGSLELAKQLILLCKSAGVDYIKIQKRIH